MSIPLYLRSGLRGRRVKTAGGLRMEILLKPVYRDGTFDIIAHEVFWRGKNRGRVDAGPGLDKRIVALIFPASSAL